MEQLIPLLVELWLGTWIGGYQRSNGSTASSIFLEGVFVLIFYHFLISFCDI
jgi:hypothetical protein